LNKSFNRAFSSAAKNVCILANGRQSDLTGSKIMNSLKTVAGDSELNFYGYGGSYMAAEGFNQTFDLDMDEFLDKHFHTYRKTKLHNTKMFWKWNGFALTNKSFTRNGDQVFDALME